MAQSDIQARTAQASEHAGRVAVVTGGNSGIGRGITDRLQREGARVWVLDVTQRAAAGTASGEAGSGGPPITFLRVDVGDERAVDEAFASVAAREGRIDYLVCCAAVFPASGFLGIKPADWERTLRVNLTGGFLCCRAALRTMRPQQFGRIVLFSSVLARTGGTNGAHYAASKGGVLGLTRSLALEVATEGVRVNSVSPGIADTPQPRGHLTDEQLYARGETIPLGRIGTVEDMVEGCLFLLSEDSSYLTGQDLRVNGGATLW
jgi:NAD(P)-dependent dehydrogenase (short-subunit alcohol dehydrogenase family)